MQACTNCGKTLIPGAAFCDGCGMRVTSGASRPETPQGGTVRCTRCGGVIPMGYVYCGTCGTPALQKAAYDRKVDLIRMAQDLKRKHGAAALVGIWVSLLVAVAILLLLLLLIGRMFIKDWYSFAYDTLPTVLLFAVPLLLVLITFAWGASRARDMKKAGLTGAQYRRLLEELRILPATFFDVSGPQPPQMQAGPQQKPASHASLIATMSVVLAIVVGVCIWIGPDGIDAFDPYAADNNGGDSGGYSSLQSDYLSGRAYAAPGYSSNGMYTEGEAFYFEDGIMYAGLADMTPGEYKESSSLFNPYDTYYTLSGTTINISGGGYSDQYYYDEDSDTINANGTTLYRVY